MSDLKINNGTTRQKCYAQIKPQAQEKFDQYKTAVSWEVEMLDCGWVDMKI